MVAEFIKHSEGICTEKFRWDRRRNAGRSGWGWMDPSPGRLLLQHAARVGEHVAWPTPPSLRAPGLVPRSSFLSSFARLLCKTLFGDLESVFYQRAKSDAPAAQRGFKARQSTLLHCQDQTAEHGKSARGDWYPGTADGALFRGLRAPAGCPGKADARRGTWSRELPGMNAAPGACLCHRQSGLGAGALTVGRRWSAGVWRWRRWAPRRRARPAAAARACSPPSAPIGCRRRRRRR